MENKNDKKPDKNKDNSEKKDLSLEEKLKENEDKLLRTLAELEKAVAILMSGNQSDRALSNAIKNWLQNKKPNHPKGN